MFESHVHQNARKVEILEEVMLPDLATPDNAFARQASEALPAGITGLVLAIALAAVMPIASASLLASSTILANDVYAGFVARCEHNKSW